MSEPKTSAVEDLFAKLEGARVRLERALDEKGAAAAALSSADTEARNALNAFDKARHELDKALDAYRGRARSNNVIGDRDREERFSAASSPRTRDGAAP